MQLTFTLVCIILAYIQQFIPNIIKPQYCTTFIARGKTKNGSFNTKIEHSAYLSLNQHGRLRIPSTTNNENSSSLCSDFSGTVQIMCSI